jgi:endonuclease I
VTRPEQADQQTLSVSGPQRSADLEMALAELEQAASRPYYDEAADRAARDAYWKHIDLGQKTPGALFEELRDTLERTHGRKLAYKPSLHVYPWVDLRPGPVPTVKSIYSGKGFDPRELIEADVAAEAERRRVAEVLAAAPGAMPFEAALESLETSLPYNCEHVVPQSWFAKKEPMRGDLHHLFTCESRCNSFRSNTPITTSPISRRRSGTIAENPSMSGSNRTPAKVRRHAPRSTSCCVIRDR